MRIGICEDNTMDRTCLRDMLEGYLREHGFHAQIDLFSNADTLIRRFAPSMYHLLLFDIYMPGTTGMRAAEQIRAKDDQCAFIFTTSSTDHAIESYGVHACGYLLKPYTRKQLSEAMEWFLESMEAYLQSLEITSNREKVRVPLRNILYIEVYGRSCIIHTSTQKISTNCSLGMIKDALNDQFLQCHRSYIVNMEHIVRPEGTSFLMTDKSLVPVTIDSVNRVKQHFFAWTFRRAWERR